MQAEDQEERGQARQVGGQVRAGELEPGEGGGRVAQDPRQLLPRQAGSPHGPRDQPQLRRLPRYRLRHLHLLPGNTFFRKVRQPTLKVGVVGRANEKPKSQAGTKHAKLRQLRQLVAANFSELFEAY